MLKRNAYTTKGQRRDSFNYLKYKFSIPVIVKDDPKKWYISYNHDVPEPLRNIPKYPDQPELSHVIKYPGPRQRFKVYKGINNSNLTIQQRERLAEDIRSTLEYALKEGLYNPFYEELEALKLASTVKEVYAKKMKEKAEVKAKPIITLAEGLDKFISSREKRGLEPKTLAAYKQTCVWLKKWIGSDTDITTIKYSDISKAIDQASTDTEDFKSGRKRKDNVWNAGTINHQWGFAAIIFKWLYVEEYIPRNPLEGKVSKIKTSKTLNKWYDRETFAKVRKELKNFEEAPWLLRVCEFVYWTMIRSKKELSHLKVGDIDFDLKQIKFRKEWTKNDSDQNRDYQPEFEKVLEEMDLRKYPKHYYIFGHDGVPGTNKIQVNLIINNWAKIRKKLGLSADYTVYGFKHTRIVHMMMLGYDSYTITHAARHSNTKTTEDYKRDYDISLTNVYKKEDLTF